jgi:exopolysaccharide production protein ExoZ
MEKGPRRLVQLQILRAVAASLVVVDHGIVELVTEGVGGVARYRLAGDLVGHYGVSAFFVLSGLIMTRQSGPGLGDRFGKRWASVRFLWDRVVRIAPLYWIATLLTYWKVVNASPWLHLRKQLALSLAFVPNFLSGNSMLFPVLVQGWTLNYEMMFYVVFALSLLLPWRWGVAVLVTVMGAMAALANANMLPAGGGVWAVLRYDFSPLLSLFVAGVVMGWVEREIAAMPQVRWRIPAWVLLSLPAGLWFGLADWIGLSGAWDIVHLFGMLAVVVCLVAREERLGWWERVLVKLGDASYATYLFHVFAVLQVGYWAGLVRMPGWVVVGLMVVGSNVLGLAVHWVLEKPMSKGLKRLGQRQNT